MLKYLTSQKPKELHVFLGQYGFLSSKFKDFPFREFLKELRKMLSSSSAEQKIIQSFKIYEKIKETPEILIKKLIFIHCILFCRDKRSFQYLVGEVLQVLQKSDELEAKQKQNPKSYTEIQSPTFMVRQLFSFNEPEVKNFYNESNSFVGWNSFPSRKIIPIGRTEDRQASKKGADNQSFVSFMCGKMIKPYGQYLMKVAMRDEQFTFNMNEDQMWRLLNEQKKLLKITRSFMHAMRYYGHKLSLLVINMVKLLDAQFKDSYLKLQESIILKREKIVREYHWIKNKNPIKVSESTKIKAKQLKQLLQEVEVINQSLNYLYYNKYFKRTICDKYKIFPPQKIQTEGEGDSNLIIDEVIRLANIQEQKAKMKQFLCLTKESEEVCETSKRGHKRCQTDTFQEINSARVRPQVFNMADILKRLRTPQSKKIRV